MADSTVRDEAWLAAGCCQQCWDDLVDAMPDDEPFIHRVVHRMFLCSRCGDKRCPRARDHRNDCGSTVEILSAESRYSKEIR